VKIQLRTHSLSAHAAGTTSASSSEAGARTTFETYAVAAGNSARNAQKRSVNKAASGIGIAPNVCRLTYTHDTPVRKSPRPNHQPKAAARRGESARRHSVISTARVASGSGNR
jgi:hypothetical protein